MENVKTFFRLRLKEPSPSNCCLLRRRRNEQQSAGFAMLFIAACAGFTIVSWKIRTLRHLGLNLIVDIIHYRRYLCSKISSIIDDNIFDFICSWMRQVQLNEVIYKFKLQCRKLIYIQLILCTLLHASIHSVLEN